jgi:hypothetical protein
MRRTWVAAVLLSMSSLLLSGTDLGIGVDSAAAARPLGRALYADDYCCDGDATLYLRVSPGGRWLTPSRSVLDWSSGGCSNLKLHLGSERRPVRIKPGGGFRFIRRRGHYVFRLRGRFTSRDRAKVRFRYRREPGRARPTSCDDDSSSLAPRRIVPFHFNDCRSHKAQTLLQAPTGRVFRELRWRPGWVHLAYACLFSTNHLVELGTDEEGGGPGGDQPDLGTFRLVGPYLAYTDTSNDCDCADDVLVKDLRSGRGRKRLAEHSVTDLELKDNGSVAWIAISALAPVESVWADDAIGLRRLDSGKISKRSLTLSGSTLTWTKDGMMRSATLQ